MAYRVVQWSTGNVGLPALRAIIEHPDLELVGLLVYSKEKAGRDAGELAGTDPVGVTATTDPARLSPVSRWKRRSEPRTSERPTQRRSRSWSTLWRRICSLHSKRSGAMRSSAGLA
ncbi:MAG: hypothetical protein ACRDY6_19655 [Acidimicrobiia bacterium]